MFILEKEKFNKFLIVFMVLLVSIFAFSFSPVYAYSEYTDERALISTDSNEGIEATEFYNANMKRYSGEIYEVTFDASFTINLAERDQITIEDNFLDNYAHFEIRQNFFTGFKFDFKTYDNETHQPFTRRGRVNMISNDELDRINMLDGFSDAPQYYQTILSGSSYTIGDNSSVQRELVLFEGYEAFPFASSSAKTRRSQVYDGSTNPYNNLFTWGGDLYYSNFKPTTLSLYFEDVSFRFVPPQEDGVYILDEQGLSNFFYDEEVTADKGMVPPPPFTDLPPTPRTNFDIRTTLTFEHEAFIDLPGGGNRPLIPGPGTGNLFSIIPSIMVAIFSFFWMIGSVELGGIPGLTLVGITTFFVSFMVIKFIIGLFKGGGD